MDEQAKTAEQVMREEVERWMPPVPSPHLAQEWRRKTIDGWLEMLARCTMESDDRYLFEELCAYLKRIREEA